MRSSPPALYALVLTALTLPSQSVIAPQAFTNVRGGGSVTTLPNAGGRTWMLGIAASELAAIPVGSVINGLSFRSGSAAASTWPPSLATWNSYDLTVGTAIPLATWTGTFASNFMTTPIKARTGPMVIEPGTFTSTATTAPQPFCDFFWDFQKPFLYLGGDLAVLFEHTGNNIASSYGLDFPSTAVPQTTAWFAGTYQATTGTVHVACVTRVHYGHGSGCPGTGGMTPNLVLSNNTVGGGKIAVSLANAPASSVAAVLLGGIRASSPLPNGCTLLTPPLVVLPATISQHGRHLLSLTVPATALGVVEIQGAVIDAGAPGGFTLSNGATLTAQ